MSSQEMVLNREHFARERMFARIIAERDEMIEVLMDQCQQLQQQVAASKPSPVPDKNLREQIAAKPAQEPGKKEK